ncbi:HEAT repeat domain-containing protein [Kitasatospora sp. NPDC051914]|uniref:HEAT repeat domain-containing protein n=1 Tax=Kitasatospora sp. NPDC051914 TaxID=3154945 RepID=UPI0034151427
MTGRGIVDGGLQVLAGSAVVLLVLLVCVRAVRRERERRRERAAEPLRVLLLELLCAEGDEEPGSLQALSALDDRSWAAVEPTARTILAKVSGQARDALAGLFEQRGVATRAMADLRRRGSVRKGRAAEVLGLLRHRAATPQLRVLLLDADPEVRTVAARALGHIGDPAGVPDLLNCLHGPHPVPPGVVLQALTAFGTAGHDQVATGLDDAEPLVRAVAVEALGAAGGVVWTTRVAAALKADPHVEVRIRAARALGALGTPAGLEPLLDAVRRGRPEPLRAVAARALGRLGASRAAPRLGELLDDPVHRVASTAARALLQVGPAGRDELRRAADGARGGRAAAHARAALAEAAIGEEGARSTAGRAAVGP